MKSLTSQLTQLKQKMEPLASQLIELKLNMLHVGGDDEPATTVLPVGDPGLQESQLAEHTNLMAEHASLHATLKAIERKHVDLMKTFDMKQKERESLQGEFEKLNRDYLSKQDEFTLQQATLDGLRKEHTKLKADHQNLETQHRNLQSRVEDSKRDYHSKQAEFTSLQATLDDLRKEHTQLKDDLQKLKTQHQEMQSTVEDSKRSESCFKYIFPVNHGFH